MTLTVNRNRFSLLLLLTIVLLASVWITLARLAAPPLIKSAYRGESLPILNSIISRQAIYPVEYYLRKWDRITRRGLVIILAIGSVVLVITRPEFQRFVDARRRRVNGDASPVELSMLLGKKRIWVVNAVIWVIIGGSLVDIVSGAENWPFSGYQMYSVIKRDRTVSVLRLFGVTDEESSREIPLLRFQYIRPFDHIRLWYAFKRLVPHPNQRQLLGEALRDCLARYEMLRRAGRHDGPPLKGVRLYRLTWRLDPWARNIDQPDRRDLIREMTQPGR